MTKLDIKRLRTAAGLTQMALALKVGVSINTIIKWENFVSTPKGSNYQKLLEIFGPRKLQGSES